MIQPDGSIAVASGGVGGEFYLTIPEEERSKFCRALSVATGRVLTKRSADQEMLDAIHVLFGGMPEDPFPEIKDFLIKEDVDFKESYWANR